MFPQDLSPQRLTAPSGSSIGEQPIENKERQRAGGTYSEQLKGGEISRMRHTEAAGAKHGPEKRVISGYVLPLFLRLDAKFPASMTGPLCRGPVCVSLESASCSNAECIVFVK
jgi:hypothetical protein